MTLVDRNNFKEVLWVVHVSEWEKHTSLPKMPSYISSSSIVRETVTID